MNVQKQMLELLGVRRGRRSGAWDQHAEILDFGAVGFPGVFATTLFLSVTGRARWLAYRSLPFPDQCCRCGEPATSRLDFRHFVDVPLIRWQSRHVHLRGIPHCSRHATAQPLAFANVTHQPGRYVSAFLVGMHRPFLEQCRIANRRDGEPPAPWVAFPQARPFGGFNQGTNEYWMRQSWGPFWMSLSAEAREHYLNRHEAPEQWREWAAEVRARC